MYRINAYPAPVYTDKTLLIKHLWPRLYLQLQKLSGDGRLYEPAGEHVELSVARWVAARGGHPVTIRNDGRGQCHGFGPVGWCVHPRPGRRRRRRRSTSACDPSAER